MLLPRRRLALAGGSFDIGHGGVSEESGLSCNSVWLEKADRFSLHTQNSKWFIYGEGWLPDFGHSFVIYYSSKSFIYVPFLSAIISGA